MWLKVLLVLVLLFAHTLCNPINKLQTDLKRTVVSPDKPPVDENVHDHIIKVNQDADLNMYEGDIFLPLVDRSSADLSQHGDVDGKLNVRSKRNAVRDRKKLWTNRVVPYEFDKDFPSYYHSTIDEAIKDYHNKTCLRFKRRTNEKNWILFVFRKGCWSAVGKSYWLDGTSQQLSLGNGCNDKATIMHEIMHAIGFWHEQSRPDRNQYVEVLWENILPGESYNFNKYSHGDIDTLKIPYDYDSIMHYGKKSFTKNGNPTIRSIHTPSRELGQRNGFTDLDLREINALYDCKNAGSPWSSWSDFGPCDYDCYKYKQRFCSSDNSADCPGADMFGVQSTIVKCSQQECHGPVDGHWGRWSAWGSCSKTCDLGVHNRTRVCSDPPPKNGGRGCVGSSVGSKGCKVKSCGLGPDDCEFDSDKMCFWENNVKTSRNYRWERLEGTTPTSGTGPQGDHTSGSGYYLFTEASSPAAAGFKAQLESKSFSPTVGRCLSFWYHMHGAGMGALNVYIKSTTETKRIWTKSGDQGTLWSLGHATITSALGYKVIFESVRGEDFRSDIGLDDVRFEEGPCIEAVGCYTDRPSDRSIPKMVANLRSQIDWYNIKKTIRQCSILSLESGYKLFGVQFYGECWSGSESAVDYKKYGANPNACWSGVGGANANFVYVIV